MVQWHSPTFQSLAYEGTDSYKNGKTSELGVSVIHTVTSTQACYHRSRWSSLTDLTSQSYPCPALQVHGKGITDLGKEWSEETACLGPYISVVQNLHPPPPIPSEDLSHPPSVGVEVGDIIFLLAVNRLFPAAQMIFNLSQQKIWSMLAPSMNPTHTKPETWSGPPWTLYLNMPF